MPAATSREMTAYLFDMAIKTKISWADSTINWWSGCTMVSLPATGLKESGCLHCYAKERDDRQMQEPVSHWGKGAKRLKHTGAVKQALALNRKPWICDHCGNAFSGVGDPVLAGGNHCCGSEKGVKPSAHRRRIFSLSLGDIFDLEVPIEWLAEALDTIRQCDQCIWILCTKRLELFFERTGAAMDYDFNHGKRTLCGWLRDWRNATLIPKNIILLTSVENQEAADLRIPQLLRIPAACHGLSVEPMLGPVHLTPYIGGETHQCQCKGRKGVNSLGFHETEYTLQSSGRDWFCVHCNTKAVTRPACRWIILGGESGPSARPCDPRWIKDCLKQGLDAGISVFVKQLGSNSLVKHNDEQTIRDKKGGDPAEWPESLRIQQWPKGF